MTIKEFSTRAGISVQAVYKRLKQKGINLDELRDKDTGNFTDEGLKIVETLFQSNTARTESIERLKIQIEKLTTQVEMLTDERDRLLVEREKLLTLQLTALQKIPAALPQAKGKFKWFWQRK